MMQPVVFDECLGWYHGGTGKRGVVLCSVFGLEELCSRQSWCLLANALAASGIPALRFDFHGTGDSGGDANDPNRLSTWLANINAAANWLTTHAGVTEFVFVGLRFGATLAAAAAQTRNDVERLVLLAPIPSGRMYGRELQLTSQVMVTLGGEGLPRETLENAIEVAGFVTTKAVLEDLRGVDLMKSMRAPGKNVLLVCSPGRPAEQKLGDHFEKLGAGVKVLDFPDYQAMMSDPTSGFPMSATITKVVAWLADGAPTSVGAPAVQRSAISPVGVGLKGVGWRETSQRFGTKLSYIGILCEPEDPAPARPCVIMLNGGRDSHIGWARGSVELARALAHQGIASFRFDLSRIGDNQPDQSGRRKMYSSATLHEVRQAIDFIEGRQFKRITLFAGCSGAYLAFHTAMRDDRIKSIALRNIARFTWRLDDRILFPFNEYLSGRKLQGADRGPTNPPVAAALVAPPRFDATQASSHEESGNATGRKKRLLGLPGICYRAGTSAVHGVSSVVSKLRGDGPRLQSAITCYSQRGGRMLAIYGAANSGLPHLDELLGKNGSAIAGLDGIEIDLIEGADHNFSNPRHRRMLNEKVIHFVLAESHDSATTASPESVMLSGPRGLVGASEG
jgi:pimeloyl-ACP methyl ester carboxylesterase